MEIKDFIFFDPDWVDGFRPKFNGFYVGPISTHKNILVKIGLVIFPQFCLDTTTHTHRHTHTRKRQHDMLSYITMWRVQMSVGATSTAS